MKVDDKLMRKSLDAAIEFSVHKKEGFKDKVRKFDESIDLIINIKDINLNDPKQRIDKEITYVWNVVRFRILASPPPSPKVGSIAGTIAIAATAAGGSQQAAAASSRQQAASSSSSSSSSSRHTATRTRLFILGVALARGGGFIHLLVLLLCVAI